MKIKVLVVLSLLCNEILSQDINFIKTSEKKLTGDTCLSIYNLKIYNNTDKPICIPVSVYYSYRLNVNDTLVLNNVNSKNDSTAIVSLLWAKEDLEMDPQQMSSYPVVINPRTYLLTNISFVKTAGIKGAYFDFKHSFGPNLDYEKVIYSFNTEPKFLWKKMLKFIDTKVPMVL